MKLAKFEISFSVESYDKKTANNCRNFYDAEKCIIYELSKISDKHFLEKIKIDFLSPMYFFMILNIF